MADLKPCPFCGDIDIRISRDGVLHNADCYACDCSGPQKTSREHAIAAWNRRTPDPRDEVIRRLVEAGSALLHEAHYSMLGGKGHLLDDMDAALAAARKLVCQPYMGQIMAECDCPRQDECQRAGRCIAEGNG